MTLQTIKYLERDIVQTGQVILGQQTDELIVVYQAYNKQIADYAAANQKLGGSNFSYNRMSWIKPNFLWMMYRCGWAKKENQENVIAIWIKKTDFDIILENAAYASYQDTVYQNRETWVKDLEEKQVRLQWDPDHDPFGKKLERRAIQLGMKGKILQSFGQEMIQRIENITDFVKNQWQYVCQNKLESLIVPIEKEYRTSSVILNKKLGI